MKNKFRLLIRFSKEVERYCHGYLSISLAVALTKALAPLPIVFIPRILLSGYTKGQPFQSILFQLVLLALLMFILRWINALFTKKQYQMQHILEVGLGNQVNEHCAQMHYALTEDPNMLDAKESAIFAIDRDDTISHAMTMASEALTALVTIIGTGAILISQKPIILAVTISGVLLNSIIFRKIQTVMMEDTLASIADHRAFGYIFDLCMDFSCAKHIRLYEAWRLIQKKLRTTLQNMYEVNLRQFTRMGRLQGISKINTEAQNVIVYGLLAWDVMRKKMTTGAFLQNALTARYFSNALMQFIQSGMELMQDSHYIQLYFDFIDLSAPQVFSAQTPKAFPGHKKEGEIIVENLCFRYPRTNEDILHNISLTIHPGEKLSIVGLNGAGKTTFVKLLARLYEPTSGRILFNGIDIAKIDKETYHRALSFVFQDFKLFAFSLLENVSCSPDGMQERAAAALQEAGFGSDLEKLNQTGNGIHTMMFRQFDPAGIEFSGGQAQKIAIARALYQDTPVVILDEPTAALDPISEYEVFLHFNQLVKGKTAIYISHRLSSTRFSDRIAVFHKGKITEYGTHAELLKQKGLYCTMYSEQAKYYTD